MAKVDEAELHLRFKSLGFEWLFDRTVGIFAAVEGGNPVPRGSAILLRIADAGFLVSAGHVLNVDSDMGILVAPNTPSLNFILVHGVNVVRTADERTVDLAFVRLPPAIDRAISEQKKFVRLSELDLDDQPRKGRYVVYGYPQESSRVDATSLAVSMKPLCYMTSLYTRGLDDFVHGTSLALEFPRNDSIDLNGDDGRMPDLRGVSGCGIWRIYGAGDPLDQLDTWEPTWIRLVGIEHRMIRGKAIKGTLVRRLVECIGNVHEDLRPAIALIK